MTRLLAWLDGIQHQAKHGHWPAYYDVGEGLRVGGLYLRRVCVNCLKGGHRTRLVTWPTRA